MFLCGKVPQSFPVTIEKVTHADAADVSYLSEKKHTTNEGDQGERDGGGIGRDANDSTDRPNLWLVGNGRAPPFSTTATLT
jgi:hypothetical protein